MNHEHCHLGEIEEIIKRFQTNPEGLTNTEAEKRLKEYGPNELKEKKKKTLLFIFLDQFKDFMILILLGAALVAGVIGEVVDTIVIIAIVIANAIIGFIQEYRAERAMEALKGMAAPVAHVIREGSPATVPAKQIVPGDVVLLEAGSIVPADMRLIDAARLQVEEAALTGESLPVEKIVCSLHDRQLPLGDRINMVYKSTIITYGRGKAIVAATGMNTEIGKIAAMLQDEQEMKTPLQKRLTVFGKKMAIAVLVICAIIFGIGILRGEEPLLMLLTAISLAVAAIPEALPAVITISLALGAKKMAAKNALIRKLPAVETLGSVTYICSDKTGTLTYNRMTVEKVYGDGHIRAGDDPGVAGLVHLMTGLALNNDVQEVTEESFIGDPTEVALVRVAVAHDYGKKRLETALPRIAELPFDSDRKCMTTIHPLSNGGYISFTKGAPEILIDKASAILTGPGGASVSRDVFLAVNEEMAAKGLRVLCMAMRTWDVLPAEISSETVESELTIVGLVGMMDPPREEAKEAVSLCRSAGIRPVMITGDHPVTAAAIAERIGIVDGDGREYVISGRELSQLSDEDFEKKVLDIQVYARVAPEQKLKIIKALQDKGQYVAMTGDGVNDAPALKRANIGVAMGITGTDVSKEAAHMILLDDNFSTIVRAVQEGRKIYDNIRKFIKYLITTNSGEIWTLFLAQIVGLPVPLLPIHILWVNLVTDSLPALALSVEPAEGNVMRRPPRNPKESVFAHGLGIHALWVGLFMAALVLGTETLAIKAGVAEWQTMVFTVLCLTQLGHALAIRSETQSLFRQGLFSNKPLLGAVSFSLVLQLVIIYVPALNLIFKTKPLSLEQLAICLGVSSLVFFAVEIEKLIRRRAYKR